MSRKLLFQIGIMLAAFFITVMAVLGVVVSIGSTTMFLNAKNEMIDRDLLRIKEKVLITNALPDMLELWRTSPDNALGELTDEEITASMEAYDLYSLNYSEKDFKEFSETAKRGLSKDEYARLCNRINDEAAQLDYKSIYLMDIRDESGGFVYCTGQSDYESDTTALGQQKNIDLTLHPAIKNILSGIYDETEYEVFDDHEGESLYIGYAPIDVNGAAGAVVCVEYDWTAFRKTMTENLVLMLVICVVMLIVLVAALLGYLRRRVINPVTEMQQSIRHYMVTKNSSDVVDDMKNITANNELKLFADDLSDLTVEIDDYIREVRESQNTVKKLTSEVMDALAKAIDAKDEYTNGHSERVAIYSRMIAKNLGLSEEEQEKIYYMGLLHDVGKIGIPKDIINKNSKLTDDEFALIQSHPILGYEILEKIQSLPDLAFGARWHHEYYNGTGYPDGLKGEEIPRLVRIIAVADSYDAMTSNRTYRKYLTQEAARAEIEKNIGTQFDPEAARCMLEIIDHDSYYALHE